MNTQTTIFETGATTAAVNELILFTDNTQKLVDIRDNIYTMNQTMAQVHLFMFDIFLNDCIRQYAREMRQPIKLDVEQKIEFKQIYVNRFPACKKEQELTPIK